MSAPLVSIIVPAYNAAPWINAALASALAQTHQPCEIIVVDDGSTDDTLARARAYERPDVIVVTQPNRGAAAARNHGLRLAHGAFIQFLDADDLLAPDKIERQLGILANATGCIASGEWSRFHADPAEATFKPEPNWRDFPDPVDFLHLHFQEGWMMQPAAWLCPRAVIDRAGPWDESLSLNDDGEYFCRVMLASAGIRFVAGARCYYRSGLPGSLSRRRSAAALRSLASTVRLTTAAVLARRDTPAIRTAVADTWQMLAYDVYPELPDIVAEAGDQVRRLGGSTRAYPAGRRWRPLVRFLGWKFTRRLQRLTGRL